MARKEEGYRVFVGGLSGDVTQRQLEDAFSRFGKILDAQVLTERETGRPRGFGFLTYEYRRAMDHAIREMHGVEFGERAISVHRAKPRSGGEDRGGSHGYGDDGGGGRGSSHGYGGDGGGGYASGGRGGGSHYAVGRGDRPLGQDECFKCGRAGHWARDCPSAALRHPPPPPPPRFEGFVDDGDRWFDRRDVRYGAKDHHYVGERRGERLYDSERYPVNRKERDDYYGAVYDGDRYGRRGGGGGKTYRDRDGDRAGPYDRPTRRRRDPIAAGAGGRLSSSYHDHRY